MGREEEEQTGGWQQLRVGRGMGKEQGERSEGMNDKPPLAAQAAVPTVALVLATTRAGCAGDRDERVRESRRAVVCVWPVCEGVCMCVLLLLL